MRLFGKGSAAGTGNRLKALKGAMKRPYSRALVLPKRPWSSTVKSQVRRANGGARQSRRRPRVALLPAMSMSRTPDGGRAEDSAQRRPPRDPQIQVRVRGNPRAGRARRQPPNRGGVAKLRVHVHAGTDVQQRAQPELMSGRGALQGHAMVHVATARRQIEPGRGRHRRQPDPRRRGDTEGGFEALRISLLHREEPIRRGASQRANGRWDCAVPAQQAPVAGHRGVWCGDEGGADVRLAGHRRLVASMESVRPSARQGAAQPGAEGRIDRGRVAIVDCRGQFG